MTTNNSPTIPLAIGDHVKHLSTGETWVVAKVCADGVYACGWPCSFAPLADIKFIEHSDLALARALISNLAKLTGKDPRKFTGWRDLCEGEYIEPADQYYSHDIGEWIPAKSVGEAAPCMDSSFRQYRRWEG